jgi:peptide subunit release factor 1 (eRF1)
MNIVMYDFEIDSEKNYVLQLLGTMGETSGTDLITYYCKEYSDLKLKKLHQEQAQARSIKSKQTQKKVIGGLDTLIDTLSQLESHIRGLSFVVFIKDKFSLVLKLPVSLAKNSYHCGKSFDVSTLQNYSELTWGLVVLDTQEVTIGVLKNNTISKLQSYEVFIPGKMKAGGQSQMRFEQTRKNLVYSHIDSVSERCNMLFPENKITKLLLGGIIPTVDLFYNYNILRPDLKKILEPPVSTVYTNIKGLEEVLEKKKEMYTDQLSTYFQEKAWYDYILSAGGKSLEELSFLTDYKIKEIYSADYAFERWFYCTECTQIKEKGSCEHQLQPLTNLLDVKLFKPTSLWGARFKRNFGTLCKITYC